MLCNTYGQTKDRQFYSRNIGGTPMVKLNNSLKVLMQTSFKLESMEPCNSVKDRIGKSILRRQKREVKLVLESLFL